MSTTTFNKSELRSLKNAILANKAKLEASAVSVFTGSPAKLTVLKDAGYDKYDIPSSQIPIDVLFIRLFILGMLHTKEGINYQELFGWVKTYLKMVYYPSLEYNKELEKYYNWLYYKTTEGANSPTYNKIDILNNGKVNNLSASLNVFTEKSSKEGVALTLTVERVESPVPPITEKLPIIESPSTIEELCTMINVYLIDTSTS